MKGRTIDFVENHRTGRPVAIIDGALPSKSEWAVLRSARAGVNILRLPGDADNLDSISPQLSWLKEIWVNSGTCTNLSALSHALHVETLMIGGEVAAPVDVSSLSKLMAFAGPVDSFPGVLGLNTLRELDAIARQIAEPISAPIERLRLDIAGTELLPQLLQPSRLKELTLFGGSTLDADYLRQYVNLDIARLAALRQVNNPEGFLPLDSLSQLVLEDCPRIERYWVLRQLQHLRVRVIGANPFPPSFRRSVASTATWQFPPGRRYLPEDGGDFPQYLYHPGLERPLSFPDEASGGVPWKDHLTERWSSLPETTKELQLAAAARTAFRLALDGGRAEVRDEDGRRLDAGQPAPGVTVWVAGRPTLIFQESFGEGFLISEALRLALEATHSE